MALARVTVWNAGDVLTAAAQNGEFNNILNNALSLISPLTGNLNCNSKQLTNLLLEGLGATATAANEGRIYYQTAEDQIHADDGTNIRRVPTISGVIRGDLIYASANNQFARLAVGTSGQTITSNGTDVSWGAGGLVRAGGSATEATTTSTSAVTVRQITGLSIAAGTPIRVMVQFRKSSSAGAQTASLGLMLNNTSTIIAPGVVTASGTAAAFGVAEYLIHGEGTNGTGAFLDASAQAGGAATNTKLGADAAFTGWPITSIEIRGLVSDATATLGVNHVQVYTMAVA